MGAGRVAPHASETGAAISSGASHNRRSSLPLSEIRGAGRPTCSTSIPVDHASPPDRLLVPSGGAGKRGALGKRLASHSLGARTSRRAADGQESARRCYAASERRSAGRISPCAGCGRRCPFRVVHRDRRSQRCGACRGQQRQGHDDEGKPSHDFSSGSAQTTVAGAFNAPLARDLHARRVAPRYARPAVRLSRQEESNGLHLQARVRGRTDGRSGDAQPSCADVVGWRHHPLGRRPTRVVGIRMRCIIAPSALTVPFKGRWHVCARPFCRGSRPKQLGGSGSKGLPAAPPGW